MTQVDDKKLKEIFAETIKALAKECEVNKHTPKEEKYPHCGKDWKHFCVGHHFTCDGHVNTKANTCAFPMDDKGTLCGKELIF